MAKGVANMPRYREVTLAANRRYLDALSAATDPGDARERIRRLARPVRTDRRSHRGLNPARQEDVELIAAVMRGEHSIQGFRNADIWIQLFAATPAPLDRKRQSQKVGRLLKLLHAHKLIAKISRSHRWRVTKAGNTTMTTTLVYHYDKYPYTHTAQAA